MMLLLRCVSAGIELRCHLGHAYIIAVAEGDRLSGIRHDPE